ncbi:hypothetical protein BC938DRAFT_480145 [Jimgerdemannia flammicorona]|uniref:Uncharacterized protein n=1 Tax=Jimgerdemannia flammicorona TaxID=994334 RepID=A0A433QJB0_9FUNG|nr:hypothetical protein BC938DRAFT_480145 [Jimgerdemannia flammicorona]
MEAIDDYANETIIRSLALTALTYRKHNNYPPLLTIASHILQQRLLYLNPSPTASPSAWDAALQWQPDGSAEAIRTLWNEENEGQDELLQADLRYRRLDIETMHAMVEFAHGADGVRYVVVMLLEEGGEVQEWRYHNTREVGREEWEGEVAREWRMTMEEAERRFVLGVAAKRSSANGTANGKKAEKAKRISNNGNSIPNQPAPEGYWGAWSDDENPARHRTKSTTNPAVKNDSDADSDGDDYWDQFAAAPGTLTPGPNDTPAPTRGGGRGARTLQSHTALVRSHHEHAHSPPVAQSEPPIIEREEMQEEYDTTYNPLHIVPSVTNMSELHQSAAIAELSDILHQSLLSNPKRASVNGVPLPAVVANANGNAAPKHQPTIVSPEIVHSAVVESARNLPGDWPETPENANTNGQTNGRANSNGAGVMPGPNQITNPVRARRNSTVGFIFDKLTSSLSNAIPFGAAVATGGENVANGAASVQKETFRPVLMQALRGIVGMARLAGYEGWDVVEMVKQVVAEQP